jgi:adenylate cyclase
MGDDEESTVQTLTSYREVLTTLIQQHNGKVLDSPGDNLLAEFVSVVDAVQCAVAVQKEISARNAELPENRRMQFRIGINLGDVIQEEGRIYGDGVNIAARLEGLAEPGGICISKTAFDHIESKLPYGYDFIGDQTVKNIAKPVGAYRVLMEPRITISGKTVDEKTTKNRRIPILIGVTAVVLLAIAVSVWQYYMRRPSTETASLENMAYPLPDKPSIAVLPFVNMSDDPEQDYFSDGITEEIITALSKTPKMLVIARNSTFTYKGKAVKVNQVAEELGVQYVLEGSVRKAGDRIRITAQLIDALSGHHLWAERFDRDLKDIFALQDEITIKIIGALQVKLTDGELVHLAAKGTKNLQAYQKLLQARESFYTVTKEGMAQAQRLCEEAIALDPDYAPAYVYLGATHWMSISLGSSKSPKKSLEKAFEYFEKAKALDKSLPWTYSQLGWLYVMNRQYDKGIAECETAINLAPNSANAYIWMGLTLKYAGRHEEAVRYSEQALRLDPFPPQWYFRAMGSAYSWVGRYEEAISFLEKALQQAPNDLFTHAVLATVYSWAGRLEEARSQAAEVLRINPKYSITQAAKRSLYKKKADRERYLGGLRKAGLPDKPPLPLPDKPSIAVLAFDNLSGDPEQEYFSDGITEQIITSISKVPHISVIARQSSFAFRDKQLTVQQIAKELGARYILEGSLQRSGERLRINAQLIDATSGHHLWAENYDRKLDDIFSVQDEICKNIMIALQVELTEGEMARLNADTVSIRAYEKFLKALEHYYRRTKEDSLIAQQLLQEAIAIDSAPAQDRDQRSPNACRQFARRWPPKAATRTFRTN